MDGLNGKIAEKIIESVQDIFTAFLMIDASPGPARAKTEGDAYQPPDSEVTAVVGYAGAFKGGIHLAAPSYVACKFSSAFAGMEIESLDDDARDAFGELANMVAGGLQTRLMEQLGYGEINLTPPVVISGDQQRMTYKQDFNSIKQYFKFAGGLFFVECFYQ